MISSQNSNLTSDLSALISRAGAKIADAIQSASAQTGVDFSYLMQQAQVESSFKSDAKSTTSSATGLYQFVSGTWLEAVRKYGDKYGLGDLAAKISDDGKVASKAVKAQILALRNDPKICALMAGELAADNKAYLQSCTNCDVVGSTELYMAHFLGAGGAAKFLNAMDKNGNTSAASLFPAAADANENIFYTASGKPRSLSQVYDLFDKKFQLASNSCTVPSTDSAASTTKSNVVPISTADKTESAMTTASIPSKVTTVRNQKSTRYDTTQNYAGIPGLQSRVILPVDVLALMRTEDHTSNKRYNS